MTAMESLAGPLNVVMFSEPSYPRHPGGAGKCTQLLAAGLAARGHTVSIVCQSTGEYLRETVDGVEVHRLPPPRQPPVEASRIEENMAAGAILDYVRRSIPLHQVDVLHDSGGFLSYFYMVEYEIRRAHGTPLFVHFQYLNAKHQLVTDPERHLRPFTEGELRVRGPKTRTQCFAVRLADQVACVSSDEAALVERLYRPARLLVLPPPLDPRFRHKAPDPSVRSQLAPSGEKLVLYGGRVDSGLKGPDVVLRAFERLLERRSDIRLVVAGRAEQKRFERLGRYVTQLGWVEEAAAVARYLSAMDAVVVPSRYEPFGMVCAEAMASGVPVIASPVGGLKEMVHHGENGFLLGCAPRRWHLELAESLDRLLSDAALARRLGQNGVATAEQFRLETVVRRLEECYYALIAEKRRRSPLTPPQLKHRDRDRYFALVKRAGRPAAESVLPRVEKRPEPRCLSCSKRGLIRDALRLVTPGRSPAASNRPVLCACPLGLLQRDALAELCRSPELISRMRLYLNTLIPWHRRNGLLRLLGTLRKALRPSDLA